MVRIPSSLVPVIALAAGVGLAPGAHADVFQQSISVQTGVEHDSNPALRSTNVESVNRLRLVPQYNALWRSETQEVDAGIGVRFERSSNTQVSQDREDPTLSLKWRRMSEFGSFGLNSRYEQASVRTTELEENGIVIPVDRTRTTKALGANWSRLFGEVTTLGLNTEYRVVTHNAAALTDFDSLSVSGSLTRALSERLDTYLQGSYSRIEPKSKGLATPSPSNSQNLVIGAKYLIREGFDGSLQGGVVQTNSTSTDTGWIGNARLSSTGERLSYSFDIGRNVAPSGVTGGFTKSDMIKASAAYALSDRMQLAADINHTKTIGTLAETTTMTYGLGLSRELSDFFVLGMRLQQRNVDRVTSTADQQLFLITLTFKHPDL